MRRAGLCKRRLAEAEDNDVGFLRRATVSPHLGLGLYVVRLVAELHQGEASACNLPEMAGVEFRMRLKGMR